MRFEYYLILFLLINSAQFKGQNSIDSIRCQQNYYYSLEISERALAMNDMMLNKYIIRKTWSKDENGNATMLNPEVVYFIQFEKTVKLNTSTNDSQQKQIDTTAFFLTNCKLDTIFILTKTLFELDSTIGTKSESNNYSEGKYAIINLNIDNNDCRFQLSFSLEADAKLRRRYYQLIEYINK